MSPPYLSMASSAAGASHDNNGDKRLRSRRWFDDPADPAMTALYLERYMNYGITPDELRGGKPIIGNELCQLESI